MSHLNFAYRTLLAFGLLFWCFLFKLLVFPLCNSTTVDNNKDD